MFMYLISGILILVFAQVSCVETCSPRDRQSHFFSKICLLRASPKIFRLRESQPEIKPLVLLAQKREQMFVVDCQSLSNRENIKKIFDVNCVFNLNWKHFLFNENVPKIIFPVFNLLQIPSVRLRGGTSKLVPAELVVDENEDFPNNHSSIVPGSHELSIQQHKYSGDDDSGNSGDSVQDDEVV